MVRQPEMNSFEHASYRYITRNPSINIGVTFTLLLAKDSCAGILLDISLYEAGIDQAN
jgi:hypothetical protein